MYFYVFLYRSLEDGVHKEEFEAVMMQSELPHECRLLYLYLRYHRDDRDGVVGASGQISYAGIREHLEYTPSPGSHHTSKNYSRDQVKRYLLRLKSQGLIVAMNEQHKKGAMVFYLPLSVCPEGESLSIQ